MGYTPRFRPQAEFTSRGFVIKRTFQPKKRYKRRVHGFLQRMSTRGGARVLRNRRRKGRHQLTPA